MENVNPVYLLYALVLLVGLVATVIVLWIYNRREARRKHALQLADVMKEWGLKWFAEGYDMYAVGDYSGLVHKVKELVQAVRTDEAVVAKLKDVTKKVASYAAEHDAGLADELRAILAKAVTPSV